MIAAYFALSTCFAADVKTYCCPSACAAKHSGKWYQANDVLRGCMRGMGCDANGATVFMRCGC